MPVMTKLSPRLRLADSLQSSHRVRWLGLVTAAVLWGGCLIPQDDTYLAGLPEQRNRPPLILETQVNPSNRVIKNFGASGKCEEEFRVVAEDLDVDDTVTVRWYVDYEAPDNVSVYREAELPKTGQPVRGAGTLRLSLRSANSPLSEPGLHVVEAVVSDGLTIDRKPTEIVVEKLPDGGVVTDRVYSVSYAWVVNTVQGDCQ
jgi:hypothetical protein